MMTETVKGTTSVPVDLCKFHTEYRGDRYRVWCGNDVDPLRQLLSEHFWTDRDYEIGENSTFLVSTITVACSAFRLQNITRTPTEGERYLAGIS